MGLIELKDIKKDYLLGEAVVHALRRVDLTIGKGEFVAIWGPSGLKAIIEMPYDRNQGNHSR